MKADQITHLFICQMNLADWERAMLALDKDRRSGAVSPLLDRHTAGQTTLFGNFHSEQRIEGRNLAEQQLSILIAQTEIINRIVACLEQNRKTVEWISVRILKTDEDDHISAERLGYWEILHEYDSLAEKAAHMRQRFHMDRENVSKADLTRSSFL